MRIVLDLQGAQTGSRFRGIGRYSLALAQAIARNANGHEIWVVLNSNFPETIKSIRAAFKGLIPPNRVVVFNVPALVSWESAENSWRRRAAELIREGFLAEMQADMVHVSSLFEGSNLCNAVISLGTLGKHPPTAITLYDLIPLLNPTSYLGAEWVRQWYMDKVSSLKRADLLLAISDSARQEAMSALGSAGEQTVTISAAHTDNFRPCLLNETEKQQVFARYGLNLPYLMYSGALESRKNLDGLLKAFALLPKELQSKHQLLFVGKVSDFDRLHLDTLASQLGITPQFVLAGHIADEDLVALLSHCALFVFPSLHEGFGLPALEAMACGAPAIGSKTTSVPEVIGRADALFDPSDPDDIAAKITQVLTDDDFLKSLREHALVQAKKFSWDLCALRAVAAFEQHRAVQPAKLTGWAEIVVARGDSYSQLIDAIGAINQDGYTPTELDLTGIARCIDHNRKQTEAIARTKELPENITWRIEGPFDSSYSLALLNRETARALAQQGHRVALHSTEGPGDFIPSATFLSANPDINACYVASQNIPANDADVTSRNLYPPRVNDMTGRQNLLHHYAWEESGFPRTWVENFNEHLQGITCLSSHVEKILIDHGVSVPMAVSGCGVDHWERTEADKNFQVTAKTFRFLHVSSCFPRKGADLLLEAYGRVFSDQDDVTLVIKTFPNPHNEIHGWLARAKAEHRNFPDVLIIEDDLGDSQLRALYAQCHALIAPSKAEGFGLPMAEAMLSGLAVITTGWGGQTDFCNDETAWLVDYKFEPAKTHFGLFDSVWAMPDIGHLAKTMRDVYDTDPSSRGKRSAKGKELLLRNFRWSDVSTRLVSSAREWAKMPAFPEPKIGWVSTWNSRCGIASYSAHLVENIPSDVTILAARTTEFTSPDGPEVIRCWDAGNKDQLTELCSVIERVSIDTLVIQFNYNFFDFEKFADFLKHQLDVGMTVVITMHATIDPVHDRNKRLHSLKSVLARCHRILVHAPGDLNRLKTLGLIDNVTLFPHGIRDYTPFLAQAAAPVPAAVPTLASYGYFLPHKGLLELINAVALLHQSGKNVRLVMVNAEYPVPESAALIQAAREKIKELGLSGWIDMHTDYLPDDESLALLAKADLIIYPYQVTGESSSAAVRGGLTAEKPVAVTPLSIFDDVAPAVFTLPGCKPEQIALGVGQLLDAMATSSENIRIKKIAAEQWRAAHRYSTLSHRLYGMLQAVVRLNQHLSDR